MSAELETRARRLFAAPKPVPVFGAHETPLAVAYRLDRMAETLATELREGQYPGLTQGERTGLNGLTFAIAFAASELREAYIAPPRRRSWLRQVRRVFRRAVVS